MVKGINKQIIEVVDTGNRYIQKAILFVRPEKADYDPQFLIHQAKQYLKQTEAGKPPTPLKKNPIRRILRAALYLALGVAIGIAAAGLFF